jgi:hypothetical protein
MLTTALHLCFARSVYSLLLKSQAMNFISTTSSETWKRGETAQDKRCAWARQFSIPVYVQTPASFNGLSTTMPPVVYYPRPLWQSRCHRETCPVLRFAARTQDFSSTAEASARIDSLAAFVLNSEPQAGARSSVRFVWGPNLLAVLIVLVAPRGAQANVALFL